MGNGNTAYDLIITLDLWLSRTELIIRECTMELESLWTRVDRACWQGYSRRLPGLGLEAVGAAPS